MGLFLFHHIISIYFTQAMKKIVLSAAALLAVTSAVAQYDINTAQDAVRYSTDNLTGTARFRAMGGAFGALGGDPSSININPAGSSIFMYNSGTASASSYNRSNGANFFGDHNTKNDNNFDLNQLGIFLVFNNGKENAVMNKFAIGFNYENTQSFYNSINIKGYNPEGSIANYFQRYANGFGNVGGIELGYLNSSNDNDFPGMSYIDQQAYMGYNAYAINPVSNDATNTSYTTNLPASNVSPYQDSYIRTSGYNGKVALNFSAQFLQKLSLGGNVNIHFTDYINHTSFIENTGNNTGTGLQYLEFDSQRYTYGGGVSFNLGAIYALSRSVRLGAAYESPTWLNLQDEVTQSIYSTADNRNYNVNAANPITMVGDDYTVKTPAKYTGSVAFIIGKRGLISVDYGLRNYANTKYTNSRYNGLNAELSQTLDWAGDLRVGTEWREKAASLRGGYRNLQSPYKNGTTLGDLTSLSGGLGYSFNGARVDLAYTWQQRKADVSTLRPGFTQSALVKTTGNNITLSFTMDL